MYYVFDIDSKVCLCAMPTPPPLPSHLVKIYDAVTHQVSEITLGYRDGEPYIVMADNLDVYAHNAATRLNLMRQATDHIDRLLDIIALEVDVQGIQYRNLTQWRKYRIDLYNTVTDTPTVTWPVTPTIK